MPKVLEMVCLLFWCPQEVLLDDQIVKLGVNINGDIIKLAADYGTQVQITSCLHTVPVELHASGGLSDCALKCQGGVWNQLDGLRMCDPLPELSEKVSLGSNS